MHSNPSLPDLMLLLVPPGEDPSTLEMKVPISAIATDTAAFFERSKTVVWHDSEAGTLEHDGT